MSDEVKVEKVETPKKPNKKSTKKSIKLEVLISISDGLNDYDIGEIIDYKGTEEELERLEKLGAVVRV